MIEFIMKFPDGDERVLGETPTDDLSRETFADHLDAIADRLCMMAEMWRRGTYIDAQLKEIFEGIDPDTGERAA